MSEGKFGYAFDDNRYVGAFDTVDETIIEANNFLAPGQLAKIGRYVNPLSKPGLISWPQVAANLIDQIDDELMTELDSDDSVIEMSAAKLQELSDLIKEFVTNNAEIKMWAVEHVE